MDKIVGLLILLVLFTGCAAQSTNTVDYNHPSTIQEENYVVLCQEKGLIK